jgi:hypothetical protein
MRNLISSARHAVSLLRTLGLRRFLIILACWTLRKFRPVVAPCITAATLGARYNYVRRNGVSRDPILVYQMAKVGSTSLYYSLQLAYIKLGLPNVPLHHLHALANLDAQEQTLCNSNCCPRELAAIHEYKQIRSDFQSGADAHWIAISMVRDPIARHISAYFHDLDVFFPDWRERWHAGNLTAEDLQQNFLCVPDYADRWFDSEIKSIFDIDVFTTDFPHDSGYTIFPRHGKITLMLLRLEDMNRIAPQAVHDLLGIDNFHLHSFNARSHSTSSDLYEQFKNLPLPHWYVERAYSTKLAQHFYTEEERTRLAEKWLRTSTTACPECGTLVPNQMQPSCLPTEVGQAGQ